MGAGGEGLGLQARIGTAQKFCKKVEWAKARFAPCPPFQRSGASEGGHACALPTLAKLRTDLLRVQAQFQHETATNQHDGQTTSDFQKSRQAPESKIFRFRSDPNQSHNAARLTRLRGARDRHERAVRCDGRWWRDRRTRRMRTVKSCGSGAAVLALSPREAKASRGRRRQKSRSPGRARSKP